MATEKPTWQDDEDHPRFVTFGLAMRNELLYGMLRELSMWVVNVAAPERWTFSSDPGLNSELRELWTAIAETHFVHVLLGLLPAGDPGDHLREIQSGYAEETAGHVVDALDRLRRFAARYPEAKILFGLFEINWSEWWELSSSGLSVCEFTVVKQMAAAEVFYEIEFGTLCSISAEAIRPEMIVITNGGEFDFEITVKVVSFDPDTLAARCQNVLTGEIKEVPLAHLRDPNAAMDEIESRIAAMAEAEVLGSTPDEAPGMIVVAVPTPPPHTWN